MAKHKKTGTLDSYATIRAIARAAPARPADAPPDSTPSETGTAPPSPTAPRPLGAHVARTVVPTKQVIQCYACGYTFQLHGRAKQINCSKCRLILDLTDHVIDGKNSDTLRTAGTIHIKPTGIHQAGDLVGSDILLEGTLEGGKLRAMRRLEIAPGALFPERAIQATDLRIAPEATVVFKHAGAFHNVEVAGTLTANLTATGVVTIRPGGLFAGELAGPHLVVEEGGGLKANLQIGVPLPAA